MTPQVASFACCCSGLPPASSLFTDSEASSEAEDDGAIPHRQALRQGAVLGQSIGQLARVSASKELLLRQDVTEPKQSKLVAAPSSDHQVCLGLHWQVFC